MTIMIDHYDWGATEPGDAALEQITSISKYIHVGVLQPVLDYAHQ